MRKLLEERLRERLVTVALGGRAEDVQDAAVVGAREARHRQKIRQVTYCGKRTKEFSFS
jgi:hypothetical protein